MFVVERSNRLADWLDGLVELRSWLYRDRQTDRHGHERADRHTETHTWIYTQTGGRTNARRQARTH